MCILFLYVGDEAIGDKERLILASNRDEFCSRPTSGTSYRCGSEYNAYIKR
jgi:uncharacterized protein with NRDE domain